MKITTFDQSYVRLTRERHGLRSGFGHSIAQLVKFGAEVLEAFGNDVNHQPGLLQNPVNGKETG